MGREGKGRGDRGGEGKGREGKGGEGKGREGRAPPIFYYTPSSSFLEICLPHLATPPSRDDMLEDTRRKTQVYLVC